MTTNKDRILDIVVVFLFFLCWVACCVAFGGVLHTVSNGNGKTDMYALKTGDVSYDDEKCQADYCSKCLSGGRGLIAMAVFGFLGLSLALVLSIFRSIGKTSMVPLLGNDQQQYAFVERVLSYTNTALIFFMIIAWGASCYKTTLDIDGATVKPTGFVFIILSLFFMIGSIGIMHYQNNVNSYSSSQGNYQASQGNYQPNQGTEQPTQAYQPTAL